MSWKSQRELRESYRVAFSTPQGKHVLADLAANANMMRSSYTRGDSHHTSYCEGARSILLLIFARIDQDESYVRELEQRRKRETRSNQENDDE